MRHTERFDLCVVGAGPGGYVAAVRAAQLGFKVACVDKEPRPGGTCLNYGCIPSKALLDSSELYHLSVGRLQEHGVRIDGVRLDLAAMMSRKDRVVMDLCENVRRLLEGNKVALIRGTARLIGPNTVQVTEESAPVASSNRQTVEARFILLAAGSEPASLPNLPFDGERIVSSTEALAFDEVPEHLIIVGGGYIGLELGSVWRRLGSRVTVVEMLPVIASNLDGQVRRALERVLVRQGMEFLLRTRVISAESSGRGVSVLVETEGKQREMQGDRLLIAVGRKPLTRGLGLEEAGVEIDSRTGFVPVDEGYRTNVPSIFAVGDLIAGPMLAHKASAEGVAAVERMAGLPGEVNYDTIPAVVYTSPEVAAVGLTEEQLQSRGVPYCVGTYPFSGAGRARCMGETEGFVKMITRSGTDRILGVHIIGPRASDMIGECVLAMEQDLTSREFARVVHGHPTFAEALHEAALANRKCSIYAP